jgi:hypothetical protein
VVQSLEQGALFALPPWAETCRVVNAYGALLNLDVRPLLRRIYAQIEAGIVELQPKSMPDLPTMTPPEPNDYTFAPGNAGAHAPNPLDIPWPPAEQAPPPQRNARPNVQSPQAPQISWPQASPQPPNAWPNTQSPQPQQSWPGSQQPPQPQRPGAPPQRQAAPQQIAADRRAAPPRAQQAPAPQPQPQFQPQPQPQFQPQPHPQPMPRRQAPPPDAGFQTADFGQAPMPPAPAPKTKRGRALLKWGIGALVLAVVGLGLWMALSQVPGPLGTGAGKTQNGTLAPDDPRSRKADRLPSPPGL